MLIAKLMIVGREDCPRLHRTNQEGKWARERQMEFNKCKEMLFVKTNQGRTSKNYEKHGKGKEPESVILDMKSMQVGLV